MQIRILLFAALREKLGTAELPVELPHGVTSVHAARGWLRTRGAAWDEALGDSKAVRMAVNKRIARDDTTLEEGDELAFFPPVTGG
jgi:sulfur-carrier protein